MIFAMNSFCCTTAVISGKYTKNGKPIIWKLRDTESLKNKMRYFNDGKYTYIGLINSDDKAGKQVWGGSNSVGFAIMNSASFNVNLDKKYKIKDQEGIIMKKALQTCANIQDFEKLLDKLPKPMGLAAHFGVIDAEGNAVFYEVNNHTYTKFDANNPAQAPNGYILRTNYSFVGKKDTGYGFIRFQTAEQIFFKADSQTKISPEIIAQNFSRCMINPILDKNYRDIYSNLPRNEDMIVSADFITRHGSSSMIMVEGVKRKENSSNNTIWTMVGFPNTCIAFPLWINKHTGIPNILKAKGGENCKLNKQSLALKEVCYPIKRSSGYKYLKPSTLINSEKNGIIDIIEVYENKIFKLADIYNKNIEKHGVNSADLQDHYIKIEEIVDKCYEKLNSIYR